MMISYIIMRTIVDIPEEKIRLLDGWCKAEGISRTEAIRRAVSKLVEEVCNPRRKISIADAFGVWADRDDIGDALVYQEKLRAEWDERERTMDEWAAYLDKKRGESDV
jgi:hypothetical protein